MTSPLVSILVPCFNSKAYLCEAIDSALSQSYPNIEVVVVDDGSTDGSLDIIKSYEAHVRWETGPNRGACAARNRALALSQGLFIQFLDADDILGSQKVELQMDQLMGGRFDLSFCRWLIRDEDRGQEKPTKREYPDPASMDPFIYTVRFPFGTTTFLQRREILERVGGFRVGVPRGQEVELLWRIGASGMRITKTDKFLYTHRLHSNPRISNTEKIEKDYMLKLFVICVLEMEYKGQIDTEERRRFVVRQLCKLSDNAHRHGLKHSSAIGFELASAFCQANLHELYRPDTKWKQGLARVLGSPWRAAEVMRWGRKLRNMGARVRIPPEA